MEKHQQQIIIGLANAHSLILLDELGRGTSSHEGMGMSHAIAEELIRRKVNNPPLFIFILISVISLSVVRVFRNVNFKLHLHTPEVQLPLSSHFRELSVTLSRYPSVVK